MKFRRCPIRFGALPKLGVFGMGGGVGEEKQEK